MTRVRIALAAAVLLAVALPGGSAGQSATRLIGTVGPGFTITLTDANGTRVTQLQPGAYQIEIDDRSEMHNFHLTGPGVNQRTDVGFVGQTTWTVTLTTGTYTYLCDPHPATMRGTFSVGGASPPPPPPMPPPPPPPPPRSGSSRLPVLVASVGPGFSIRLAKSGGGRASSVKAGRYRITVRDRSEHHNFHLVGRGVNKRTSVAFVGTQTWTVTLRKGRTYRFVCDPHARSMRGRLRVR